MPPLPPRPFPSSLFRPTSLCLFPWHHRSRHALPPPPFASSQRFLSDIFPITFYFFLGRFLYALVHILGHLTVSSTCSPPVLVQTRGSVSSRLVHLTPMPCRRSAPLFFVVGRLFPVWMLTLFPTFRLPDRPTHPVSRLALPHGTPRRTHALYRGFPVVPPPPVPPPAVSSSLTRLAVMSSPPADSVLLFFLEMVFPEPLFFDHVRPPLPVLSGP